MREWRVKVKPFDIIICATVVFVSVLVFLIPMLLSRYSENSAEAALVICADGEQTFSLKIDGEYILTSEGHILTLKIQDGGVSVTDSSCPDGICAGRGEIRRVGEIIVCAPARVSVKIIGGGEYDAILY